MVHAVAFTPAGRLLASASADRTLKLWREGRVLETLEGHTGGVLSAAFSLDGAFAVSGTKDGYVYLWQMPTREAIRSHRLQTDPQGKLLTLTHFDPALDANKIRLGVNLQNPETPEFPDGRLIPGRRVTLVIDP